MHGRVKVRTSEEQAEAKRKEQQEKLKVYSSITAKIFAKKKNDELDNELLELTRGILEKNPDFYTFWNYRREVLLHIKPEKDVEELKKLCLVELDLTQHCLKVNPKSYSAWNHRYWMMEYHPEADWKRELKLCNYFLSQDERNFHCWDYRRLVAKKCGVSLEEELEYSTKLIETNFSNYSAWHYRSKLLPIVHFDSVKGTIKEDILLKEFELIKNAAFTDPDDQSVWFYHRWLLGKSKIPLQILNVSFLKTQQMVAVLLSESVQISCKNLLLNVNDISVDVEWKSINKETPASTLWFCNLPKDFSSGDGAVRISVTLKEGEISDSLSCCINDSKSFTWKISDRKDMFRYSLSAAAKDVLENELKSCQQLNELEPNCKWTIFTCILLMRALNNVKFENQIEDYMKKLTEIDSSRKNYYNDLGSKFTIENTMERLPMNVTEINLSGRNLTSLHYFDQFLLIEHINLSSNNLTSIYPFQYLVNLKSAILDDNQLSCLKGTEQLKNLKSLSVKKNSICKIKTIEMLKTCLNLKEIFIEDNPVVTDADYLLINRTEFSFKIIDSTNM